MRLFLTTVFIFTSFLIISLWSEVLRSPFAEIAFLDVGQGDAIYIESPHGHQVLIDGGPNTTVLSKLSEVMPHWDKTLDVIILTHPDADHIAGLIPVLESFEVKMVVWTGKTRDTRVFEAWKDAVEREGAEFVAVAAGDRIVLGNSGVVLDVLYPFPNIVLEEEETNETSLIMRMRYGEHSMLLTGDTTRTIEEVLVEEGVSLRSDILKVAHHGSQTSTSSEFVRTVAPHTAVISAGEDNRFGHPHDSVLANLAEYGIVVRRTDKEDTIVIYLKL